VLGVSPARRGVGCWPRAATARRCQPTAPGDAAAGTRRGARRSTKVGDLPLKTAGVGN